MEDEKEAQAQHFLIASTLQRLCQHSAVVEKQIHKWL
jgi:hypothetical protein